MDLEGRSALADHAGLAGPAIEGGNGSGRNCEGEAVGAIMYPEVGGGFGGPTGCRTAAVAAVAAPPGSRTGTLASASRLRLLMLLLLVVVKAAPPHPTTSPLHQLLFFHLTPGDLAAILRVGAVGATTGPGRAAVGATPLSGDVDARG